jgi:hypothetical protein
MIASVGRMMRKGGGGLSWPAGMKEHIKAWYDPKKQGMTNFDVIESYADDFTKWRIENTGVTSTQKKIVIAAGTELKYNVAYKGFGNSIAKFDIKYTGNAVIRYQYNKEDGTTGIITINRSGIYHLPASIKAQKNFGFYCNPQTVTEEATIEQLPTSILKDLSGNGNHAYLYGGKGKLNSGMGVYQEDFTTWSKIQGIYELGANSFNWKYSNDTNTTILTKGANETKSMKVIIEGLSTNILQYAYYEESVRKILEIKQDGEYVLPFSESNSSQTWNGFAIIKNEETVDITITQIPDYPNQLCYDGMMYAVCYGFPILTDYAVMADRTWFDIRSVSCFIGKRNRSGDNLGAFEFEFRANQALSFGRTNSIIFADSGIVYQTKNSYNGIGIESGLLDDTDVLIIGAAQQNINNKPQDIYIGCHGKIIIADRSFTEDEITWLKDNLFRK